MVGDRSFDILGGKQYGLVTVGVSFGYAKEGELEEAGADYVVDTVEELRGCCYNDRWKKFGTGIILSEDGQYIATFSDLFYSA